MAGSLDIFEADLADDISTRNIEANQDPLGDDDDPFALPPPLAAFDFEDGGVVEQPAEGEHEKKDDKERKTKKLIKRSPQARLDERKLCSEDKGIPALLHICDNVTFKGKGHEASDLRVLLQCYEHWAHRLFPKFPFENVVNQAEKLGHKKLVQNCIKRLRRGEDEILRDEDKDSDEEILNNISIEDAQKETTAMVQPVLGEQIIQTNPSSVAMTPEVLERIRQNRLKALEKRAAAQVAVQQKDAGLSKPEDSTPYSEDADVENTSFVKQPEDDISMVAEKSNGEVTVESNAENCISAQSSPTVGDDCTYNHFTSEQPTLIDQDDDDIFESDNFNLAQEKETNLHETKVNTLPSDTSPVGDLYVKGDPKVGVSPSLQTEATNSETSSNISDTQKTSGFDGLTLKQMAEMEVDQDQIITLAEENTEEQLQSDVQMVEVQT